MALLIARHGRTTANASGLLLGRRLDPGLDTTGRAQADALARVLGHVERIIASPLERARETAAAVSASTGVAVEIDARWIELDYGELDGVPLADVGRDTWARWRSDPTFAPPGGESLAALGARVREGCGALAADAAERDVLVVTHVSPVKAAVAWALGVGDDVAWRMFVAPGSITTIAVGERGPSLHGYNAVAHLA